MVGSWPFRTSYWIDAEPAREPALANDIRCDIVVVGGGFAGLSTAFHLKDLDPGLDVVLIEADHCGAGASGKNQGIPAPHTPDAAGRLRSALGEDGLRRNTAYQLKLLDDYELFCDHHNIECEFRRSKAAWIVTTQAQLGYARALTAGYEPGRFPFRELDATEAQSVIGVPAIGGIEFGTNTRADFNPFKFVQGLRRLTLERGTRMFEGTPALAVEPRFPARVRTPGGSVVADQVVIATNAYTGFFPRSDALQTTGFSYNIVTEPLDDGQLELLGWSGEHSLINEIDPGLEWQAYRVLRDSRLFWSIGGEMFRQPPGVLMQNENREAISFVYEELLRRFPFFRDVAVVSAHGAALDTSQTHYPVTGRFATAENIFITVGYSGHGIMQSFDAGITLAQQLLGPSYVDGTREELRLAYRDINEAARGLVL